MSRKRLVKFSSLPPNLNRSPTLPGKTRSRKVIGLELLRKHLLAVVCALTFIVIGSALVLLVFGDRKPKISTKTSSESAGPPSQTDPGTAPPAANDLANNKTNTTDNAERQAGEGSGTNSGSAAPLVRQNANAFMGKLTNAGYSLDDAAVEHLTKTVDSLRQSTHLRVLLDRRQDFMPLVIRARGEDLNPAYVIFFCVLDHLDGRAESPKEMITSGFSKAKHLAVMFGKDGDSYLLSVAAAAESGKGSGTPPLLGRMRQTIADNRTQRNVWYLHEVGAITETSYQRVLEFIALGTISQNPRAFGIDADPLVF